MIIEENAREKANQINANYPGSSSHNDHYYYSQLQGLQRVPADNWRGFVLVPAAVQEKETTDSAAKSKDAFQWAKASLQIQEDTTLSMAAKNLAVCLRKHQGDNYFCWPSVSKLAVEIGRSPRRTQELLRQLEERGYLETVPRLHNSSYYHLHDGTSPFPATKSASTSSSPTSTTTGTGLEEMGAAPAPDSTAAAAAVWTPNDGPASNAAAKVATHTPHLEGARNFRDMVQFLADQLDLKNQNLNTVCESISQNLAKSRFLETVKPEPAEPNPISPLSAHPPFPLTASLPLQAQEYLATSAPLSNPAFDFDQAAPMSPPQPSPETETVNSFASTSAAPAASAVAATPELVKQVAAMYQAEGVFEREAYILANFKPDVEYAAKLIAQSRESWVEDRPAMIYFYGSRGKFSSRRRPGAAATKASKGKSGGKGKRSTANKTKNSNYAYTEGYHPDDYTGPVDFSQYQETQPGSDTSSQSQADYLDLNNSDDDIDRAADNDAVQPQLPPEPAAAAPRIWIQDGYVIRPAKSWEKYEPSQVVPDPRSQAIAPVVLTTADVAVVVADANTTDTPADADATQEHHQHQQSPGKAHVPAPAFLATQPGPAPRASAATVETVETVIDPQARLIIRQLVDRNLYGRLRQARFDADTLVVGFYGSALPDFNAWLPMLKYHGIKAVRLVDEYKRIRPGTGQPNEGEDEE